MKCGAGGADFSAKKHYERKRVGASFLFVVQVCHTCTIKQLARLSPWTPMIGKHPKPSGIKDIVNIADLNYGEG